MQLSLVLKNEEIFDIEMNLDKVNGRRKKTEHIVISFKERRRILAKLKII